MLQLVLIKALKKLQNQKINENELAKMACNVEQDLIKETVGIQDQYSASFGGILELEMYKNNIIANRLNLNDTFINEFESHVLLGYTGINRKGFLSDVILAISLLGVSLPTFVIGILFIYLFAVILGVLPSFGRGEVVDLGFWTTGFLTISFIERSEL